MKEIDQKKSLIYAGLSGQKKYAKEMHVAKRTNTLNQSHCLAWPAPNVSRIQTASHRRKSNKQSLK